ncbi:MAG: type III-B CRISPR module RAMP protein Cmr1 [Thermodesulfobacteriota bacterium]|nr:type III-B CRISPR module RAMP protein Cmr1 [Thermodesulfobacteriota bacterium]
MAFNISRFKGLEQKEFEVETVTPLFLGGANPKKAELRAPSIKGALRFWWRALYGSDDLFDMKRREAKRFGSTDEKSGLAIKIIPPADLTVSIGNIDKGQTFTVHSSKGTFKLDIIDYLAFGLKDRKKGYIKEHIPPQSKFLLNLYFSGQYSNEIMNTFYTFINFGGCGARSRNGFGSFATKKDQASSLDFQGSLQNFSSFSNNTILFNNFAEHNRWEDALSEVGLVYKDARLSLEKKHTYNKRLLVAKPIVQAHNNDRHAKPYFLHVNKLQNGKYKGQILFMPYEYYDQSKRKEYLQTCEAMNQKISELTGGLK